MKEIHFSAKRTALVLSLCAFPLFFACKEDSKKENPATETTSEAAVKTEAVTPAGDGDVALNPAHGQPGHRCDLPVGAPLNATNVNTTTKSQSPLLDNSGSGETTAKVNPPHGQPGHRCDIKVGDPL
ncbi:MULTISPECIES: hypothetical protein [Altibacter]|uniref:hypothetical protein n=1 Tax=Altibacter TaxID=1535231 RepID=UPI00068D972E|nr:MULTISPECIES: hypothetical protein [Altibacter]MCW8980745.1 hypothetical protein [Altibacter sp.]MCW9038506.1 hypothetical protein [Altibacter sp.]